MCLFIDMKNKESISNLIFDDDLGREICKMIIFRATSSQKDLDLVLDSCCSMIVLSLELAEYIVTLGKSDPIYKFVENAMKKKADEVLGV